MQFLIFRNEFIVDKLYNDNTSLLMVYKLYQRSLGSYNMNM